MAKKKKSGRRSSGPSGGPKGGSLIGAVGGVIIGAAILLFVATLVLNSLKDAGDPGGAGTTDASRAARNASWASLNDTVGQMQTMLTVSAILLAVLGIVMVGASIIGYIGGAFGG